MEKKSFGSAIMEPTTPQEEKKNATRDGRMRVSAWKTTDGEVFTDATLARNHQKSIDREEKMTALLGGIGDFSGVDAKTLAKYLLNNREELVQAIR